MDYVTEQTALPVTDTIQGRFEARPVHSQLAAQHLGLEALACLLDASLDGIVLVDDARRYIYANPSACHMMGYALEDLIGRDFLINFPEREHAEMLAHFADSLEGQPGLWLSTLLLPDGTEREVEYSNMKLVVNGRSYGSAIFRDVTETHRLEREGAAMEHVASRLAFGGSLKSTLDVICKHVVEATGMTAASVVLMEGDPLDARMIGTYGLPDGYEAGINRVIMSGVRLPSLQALVERKPVLVPAARQLMLNHQEFAPVHALLHGEEWNTLVAVPMVYGDIPVGTLLGYLARQPEEAELRFLSLIANQAALAVRNAQLLVQAQDKAATEERQHLARELHDSVNQALFSLNLMARSAEVVMVREGLNSEVLQQRLSDLRHLAQTALAEMRSLIFELRPGALHEEGLVEALRKHAAGVQARDMIQVEVHATCPEELPRLSPAVEEALYRIAQEALHNVVKHAGATRADISLGAVEGCASLSVSDNGAGFDPAMVPPGHMGLGTMRQRVEALNGNLTVESCPGSGTTITAKIPV